jgi:nitroreductase / dihydropteridine reductase
MSNQILEDLRWRYTTKKYDPGKKIPQKDLDVLFEAMRLSASSINSQPWKFIVIETDAAKERMYKTFAHKYQFNQPHIFESSHIILFAHNPRYTREDYSEVVDNGIKDKRTKPEERENSYGAFMFAELNTDETGYTGSWTKAQTYIALGNTLHTLARLRIDSTPMEGIDSDLISEEFKNELDGHRCDVALAIGYRHPKEDHNAELPKSRRSLDSIIVRI